jgi:hypothetical protein
MHSKIPRRTEVVVQSAVGPDSVFPTRSPTGNHLSRSCVLNVRVERFLPCLKNRKIKGTKMDDKKLRIEGEFINNSFPPLGHSDPI